MLTSASRREAAEAAAILVQQLRSCPLSFLFSANLKTYVHTDQNTAFAAIIAQSRHEYRNWAGSSPLYLAKKDAKMWS
jgi:hypothetical protein